MNNEKTINWDYSGTISKEITEIADEVAGYADTVEEAEREFMELAGKATGAEAVTFFYE